MNKIIDNIVALVTQILSPSNQGFIRHSYLQKITPFLGNRLIKVLVGQRRTGKSYLLRQLMTELVNQGVKPSQILYINKEMSEFNSIATDVDLNKLVKSYRQLHPTPKLYLFIDETQLISHWEKAINSLSQHPTIQTEIMITGSNSTLLSSELATLLTGRYIKFLILPYSYSEYLEQSNQLMSRNSYLTYLTEGGLPELTHLQGEEVKRQYVSSLKDSILLRDIVERYAIKDVALLNTIFLFLVQNTGNLTSINSLVTYFKAHGQKTNSETLSAYITYLTQTYLIYPVSRYDIRGKNIISSGKKYFINDLSLRTYLHSGFEFGFGQRLENAIYLHYLKLGYHITIGSLGKKEIDFIIEKDSDKKYVQVAYTLGNKATIKREFDTLLSINDNYEKIIISLDESPTGNYAGIKHVQAWTL